MRQKLAIGAFCGLVGLAGAANADSIDQAQLTDGSQSVTGLLSDGSATATAYADYANQTTGVFSHFSVLGLEPAAGVRELTLLGGDRLIDGAEAIAFDFANAVAIDRLDVAFLYRGLWFQPGETATFEVTYADNSVSSFTLTPTSLTSATYTGPASSISSDDFGVFGEWRIADPFGQGLAVSRVALLAGSGSDFGFEELCVSPVAVPLPAAMWSGMALMGAIGAVRMRKRMLGA